MNTAPYHGVSTDYNGRPLRKAPASNSSVATVAASGSAEVAATQW
ncbi:hypothetical protein [Hymenobacter sp. AT01-02]|nr:hypothetical protein [Hymenobacter sp. AT01-02]